MKQTLILYSTIDGHTQAICKAIAKQLGNSASVHMSSLDNFVSSFADTAAQTKTLTQFDTIVVGASIRYGQHRPNVIEFLNDNAQLLSNRKTALFSVNLVARKPEKNTVSTNSYFVKLLEQVDIQPHLTQVFAGKLDYARYGFFDKLMIKFIMWVTKGPTSSEEPVIYTDWEKVNKFSQQIKEL